MRMFVYGGHESVSAGGCTGMYVCMSVCMCLRVIELSLREAT